MNFPLRHISIRVPWHDSGWNGTVCAAPGENTACLKLRNIFEKKQDAKEIPFQGRSLKDLPGTDHPPCVKERGTFMAPFAFDRSHEHPYCKTSPKTHAHFRPTRLHYPAYAAAGLPFRWTNKEFLWGNAEKNVRGLVQDFPLEEMDQSFEPDLSFKTNWIQDYRNHRTALECFWKHVRPEQSLVFFYAKQVPLIEDTGRRVLVGAGRVLKMGSLTEYEYEGGPDGKIRSLIWESMVSHSIRPDFKDGFLLPYHDALVKCDDGRKFDPAEVVALAPEDRFVEFSYATEHVPDDTAISALLSCRDALLRASLLFSFKSEKQEAWIDLHLGRLWKRRGPFPGLGAVLIATGVPMGNFIAQALTDKVGEQGNPWPAWDAVVADPKRHLALELSRHIGATIGKSWQRMQPERRKFLELLSRSAHLSF
jgi:hypothetical protein